MEPRRGYCLKNGTIFSLISENFETSRSTPQLYDVLSLWLTQQWIWIVKSQLFFDIIEDTLRNEELLFQLTLVGLLQNKLPILLDLLYLIVPTPKKDLIWDNNEISFSCNPIEYIACTYHPCLYSLFLKIETKNVPSPSVKPVINQGSNVWLEAFGWSSTFIGSNLFSVEKTVYCL